MEKPVKWLQSIFIMCGCACGGAWRLRNWRNGQTRGVVSV